MRHALALVMAVYLIVTGLYLAASGSTVLAWAVAGMGLYVACGTLARMGDPS